MSEKLTTKMKEDEGEYKVPEFYNANWRDDVEEEAKAESEQMQFEIFGDNEKNEREYISPEEVSDEAMELLRMKQKKIGQKVIFLSKMER